MSANWPVSALTGGALVLATVAAMQGYLGGWFVNVVRPTELAAAQALLDDVTAPANITMAGPIWPERPDGSYVKFRSFQPPSRHAHGLGCRVGGV